MILSIGFKEYKAFIVIMIIPKNTINLGYIRSKKKMQKYYSIPLFLMIFFFVGCSQKELEPIQKEKFSTIKVDYQKQIQPILDKRCVVCHSCYNAPCQLKLSSFEGFARGGSKIDIYGNRLKESAPTRLFIDASRTQDWREKGFHSVLNRNINENESIAMHVMNQKKRNPLSKGVYESEESDLNCSKNEKELSQYIEDNPHKGMPFGFPELKTDEYNLLMAWLSNSFGSVSPKRDTPHKAVEKWEAFFNNPSIKHQVTARYIYEHLFIGHLYFENNPKEFYELVRSSTPPAQPIKIIPTRLPYDDPGKKVYYRFQKVQSTIVDKTHMVVKLNEAKLIRYKELFIQRKWNETPYIPSYEPKISSNPFKTFKQIPADSRYKFLLDDAYFMISNFIKGPVCKGQIALNVINDHFWVFFLDPNYDLSVQNNEYLIESINTLSIPNEKGSNPTFFGELFGKDFNDESKEYYKNRGREYAKKYPKGIRLEHIWKDKANGSSVLTIYRHFDSASLHKGALGNIPKTLWVIDYPLLERIYYSLVAGFDIFGNIPHQVMVRQYMNRLRIEGESNFLDFLPNSVRKETFDEWYQGWISKYLIPYHDSSIKTGINYNTQEYKKEFVLKVLNATNTPLDKLNYSDNFNNTDNQGLNRELPTNIQTKEEIEYSFNLLSQNSAATIIKKINHYQANVAYIRIKMEDEVDLVYSMIVNRWHDNVAFMFNESSRLNPSKDDIDFVEGFIGSYPNFFFVVNQKELNDFFDLLKNYQENDTYEKKLNRYGINRSNKDFWEIYDWFQQEYTKRKPIESGLFDLNRYYKRAY